MNITRLVKKMFVGLFLTSTFVPLQSCSNTLIGEKLENSFDVTENSTITKNTTKVKIQTKANDKNIKSNEKDDDKNNENILVNIADNSSISNKDRFIQKNTIRNKKVIFKPQPYRIILKLSGANPSAPAETVTAALRKAGVEFEVEKIERFEEESLLKDSSSKR